MTEDERAELDELRGQIRALQDRQEILDVCYRYARALTATDEEIYSSAYHEDAIVITATSSAGVTSSCHGASDCSPRSGTRTRTTSPTSASTSDGDVAHSECYVLFVQRRRDSGRLDIGGGRYIDRVERRGAAWRIAARELVVEWSGEASSTSFGGTESTRTAPGTATILPTGVRSSCPHPRSSSGPKQAAALADAYAWGKEKKNEIVPDFN